MDVWALNRYNHEGGVFSLDKTFERELQILVMSIEMFKTHCSTPLFPGTTRIMQSNIEETE